MITDRLGLVVDNGLLVALIPATRRALVFRVIGRANKGYEVFDYGPLPLTSGTTLSSYDGGTVTVPADGVLPARAYTTRGISFPLEGAYDRNDMWYVPEEHRDRLFHVHMKVVPAWIKCDVEVPPGASQGRFQKGRIVTGIDKDTGFRRGGLEMIHIPKVRYGYRFGNDTNVPVYTMVKFIYAEYMVEIPKDAEYIFNVITKKIPAYWITLPFNVYDDTIRRALNDTYGFEGFPIYGVHEKSKAIPEYEDLLREVKV